MTDGEMKEKDMSEGQGGAHRMPTSWMDGAGDGSPGGRHKFSQVVKKLNG